MASTHTSSAEELFSRITFSQATYVQSKEWADEVYKVLGHAFARGGSTCQSNSIIPELLKEIYMIRTLSTPHPDLQEARMELTKLEQGRDGRQTYGDVSWSAAEDALGIVSQYTPDEVSQIFDVIKGLTTFVEAAKAFNNIHQERHPDSSRSNKERLKHWWRKVSPKHASSMDAFATPALSKKGQSEQIRDHDAEVFETVQSRLRQLLKDENLKFVLEEGVLAASGGE